MIKILRKTNLIGGAEIVAQNLNNLFLNQKLKSELISIIPKYVLKLPKIFVNIIVTIKLNLIVLFSRKTDIYIGNNIFRYYPIIFFKSRVSYIEIIHLSYFEEFYYKKRLPLKRKIFKKILLKNLKYVVVLSSYDKYLFQKDGLNNVVDIQNFSFKPIKQSYKIKNSIVYVGRFSEQKNLSLLKEIIYLLQDNYDFTLYISGHEKKIIEYFKNTRVIIHINKIISLDDLKHFKAMILTSYYEGMPLSILEGLAAGLNVFSTNNSFATKELVDTYIFEIPFDSKVAAEVISENIESIKYLEYHKKYNEIYNDIIKKWMGIFGVGD